MAIRLSETFVRWVIEVGSDLVGTYYGSRYNPRTGLMESNENIRPLQNEMDHRDRDLLYWAESLLYFAKTVAGVLAHELDYNNFSEIDLAAIMDEEIGEI